MKDKLIGSGKPKRVNKSPWVCRIRNWAKDAQGKQMGQGYPRRKQMGQMSPQAM